MPTPTKLLLLDGHSLAYRAFYALPETLTTQAGQQTNAVYGFLSMLAGTLRDEAPTHLAAAFDVSRSTFRTQRFPEYKANRASSPQQFREQVPLIQQALTAMSIPVLMVDGFEADDIIATLARRLSTELDEVAIVTGDRDALQLVNDRITVLYPRKGVSDLARMTPEAVEQKYGVRPDQYADLAALRGDSSDNLPGVPGVGEKTAAKLIGQYGSVQGVADAADRVTGKVGESLRSHLPAVLLNRELTELVDDVPLATTAADAALTPWDTHALFALLDDLEIGNLRDRLMAVAPQGTPAPSAAARVARADSKGGAEVIADGEGLLLTAATAAPWIDEHLLGHLSGVEVIGSALHGTGTIAGIAWAVEGACAYLPGDALVGPALAEVARWAADEASAKCVGDGNSAGVLLDAIGAPLAAVTQDIALAAYLLAPDVRRVELEALSRRHLGVEPLGASGAVDQLDLGLGDDAKAQAAAARSRAQIIYALGPVLEQQLVDREQAALLHEVEIPVTEVLVEMERAGIAVDRDALASLSAHFAGRADECTQQARSLVGHEINLASPKQLQAVLFDELAMPKTKKTKTGYSTDAESLADLFERTEHPFLGLVLTHRDAAKLRSTVDGLLAAASPDGRIRTTFTQTIAATGRLSSLEPNVQNIPVRTAEGRRIRECFMVGEGFECLLTADYSQIEMRIMAHLSGDAALIEALRSGEDLHSTMAAAVFGVAQKQVDAEMRRRIKAMSYGLAYGLSAFGLARQLAITPPEAQALMDNYFVRFQGVQDYLASVVEEARATGYTTTVLGRRRYFPDLTSESRPRREAAERMALNAPIQGSAADIMKVAMLAVRSALRSAGARSRVLLQVHDELVLEIAPGERVEVESLVRDQMGAAYPLSVPLDVSMGFGANWDEAAH